MNFPRFRLPRTNLGRARLVALVFALVAVAGMAPMLGGVTGSERWDHLAVAAQLLLGVLFVGSGVRQRTWAAEPVLGPLLCLAVSTALRDPLAVLGLLVPTIVIQSLYGSFAAWIVRLVCSVLVMPAALLLSPAPTRNGFGLDSSNLVGSLPQLILVGVMTRAIYAALRHQQETGRRERIVARAGARLLAAPDVRSVYGIAAEASAELIATAPGLGVLVVTRHGDTVRVVQSTGMPVDAGRALPATLLTDPGAVVPGFGAWLLVRADAAPFDHGHEGGDGGDQDEGNGRLLLLAAPRSVPPTVADAFRSLGTQIMLAEANRASHAELDRRAHYDHLTGLPNRAKLHADLATATDREPAGTMALLAVDLDDFKQVNDTYGHGAGDELLVQVAGRLTAAAGNAGIAARFGGDEFALLLTGLSGPAEATLIAETLCARLIEPLKLTATTVTVGARIGVAVHEPGVRTTELTRRADLAMYSAKSHGKNRVRTFTADAHAGTLA